MRPTSFAFFSLLLLGSCFNASSEEEKAWKEVTMSNTISALDSFLSQFPNTSKKEKIALIREGILYNTAKSECTDFYFNKYRIEFPQGKHREELLTLEKNQMIDPIDWSILEGKSFVGSFRYFDNTDPKLEVLSLKFEELNEEGDIIEFTAIVRKSFDQKKRIKGRIQKGKNILEFIEGQEDTNLMELSTGKFYKKGRKMLIESTDPSAKHYWRLI